MLEVISKRKKYSFQNYSKVILMIFLTIITQAIMLIKTSIVASNFGISVEMDAFNFSNSIGTFIYSFIGAGITTVLIPNLVSKDKQEGINIFISVLYSIAFIILLIVHFIRITLVETFAGNNDTVFITVASNVMFITLITQYINSFTGATSAIFQCSGKFNLPKFITLLTTTILVILILLESDLTIYKYAFYILLTTVVNVICQLYLVKDSGFNFRFKIDYNNNDFRNMMKVFMPTILSTGLYQFSLLVDSIIATGLGQGEVSKLTYCNTIITLINTIILSNIMIYFYPKISRDVSSGNMQKRLFDLSILINTIMIFIVVLFSVVGKEGISILYERGQFTSITTNYVFWGSMLYIIGIPSNAYRDLIYRYFYASGDTLTPFKNSLIISILNIIISIFLSKHFGIYGVILGTVLTSYMSMIMILVRFNKKFKLENCKKLIVLENCKLILVAVVTVILTLLLKAYILPMNKYIFLVTFSFFTLITYILLMFILKSRVINLSAN